MNIKPEDFKLLQYDVYNLKPEEDILKSFPDLKRFKEFKWEVKSWKSKEEFVTLDSNKVLRYIIYCYDKKSPFLSEKNLLKRKVLCATEAKFDIVEGKFNEHIEKILKGQNDIVNRMIVRYVRNQRDLRYALLVSGMENYYDNIAKLEERKRGEEASDGIDKTKLFDQTHKMLDDLEKLSDEVFNGDVELVYTADEVNQEETEIISSYPEYIASLREIEDAEV